MVSALRGASLPLAALTLMLAAPCGDAREPAPASVVLPAADAFAQAPKRRITVDDLAAIRDIDSLSLSADGRRFAILVRQGVPDANSYRMTWFVGSTEGAQDLTPVGAGGEMRLLTRPNGSQTGDVATPVSRWAPDGRSIAYTLQQSGEVQLWRSSADGRSQLQLTRNRADVRDFAWSLDGRRLFFTVGSTRAEHAARAEAAYRAGYLFQAYSYLFRVANPGVPDTALEADTTLWVVGADGRGERQADADEQAEFADLQRRQNGLGSGVELNPQRLSAALRPPIVAHTGALAWLEREDRAQTGALPLARLRAAIGANDEALICNDPRCSGYMINSIWWTHDAREVVIFSRDGATGLTPSLYAWSPETNAVRTILSDDAHHLRGCEMAAGRLVCLRESPLEPRHVASIDLASGAITKIADVNPEFSAFELGEVHFLEWDNPADTGQFGYPARTRGVLLLPPGHDPEHPVPLFVAPYRALGFLRGDVGDEHPLLVYAANGIAVLNSNFPLPTGANSSGDPAEATRRLYDPGANYPHLRMLAGATFAGIDRASAIVAIDNRRLAIGGASHGAFVPLYMMQLEDRFAALSVAHGAWNDTEHTFGPLPYPFGEQQQPLFPEDPAFWRGIDLSQHVDTIEAPVLFHITTQEAINVAPLVRRMSTAKLPFEARAFHNESHLKFQPAHRLAIYTRNLDWFRFWLQDIEDPAPRKAEQYEAWRQLRELQCRNRRSLRDYCAVASTMRAPAR